jgi:hypothetical protein
VGFVVGDVRDAKALVRALDRVDAVNHLVALVNVGQRKYALFQIRSRAHVSHRRLIMNPSFRASLARQCLARALEFTAERIASAYAYELPRDCEGAYACGS